MKVGLKNAVLKLEAESIEEGFLLGLLSSRAEAADICLVYDDESIAVHVELAKRLAVVHGKPEELAKEGVIPPVEGEQSYLASKRDEPKSRFKWEQTGVHHFLCHVDRAVTLQVCLFASEPKGWAWRVALQNKTQFGGPWSDDLRWATAWGAKNAAEIWAEGERSLQEMRSQAEEPTAVATAKRSLRFKWEDDGDHISFCYFYGIWLHVCYHSDAGGWKWRSRYQSKDESNGDPQTARGWTEATFGQKEDCQAAAERWMVSDGYRYVMQSSGGVENCYRLGIVREQEAGRRSSLSSGLAS